MLSLVLNLLSQNAETAAVEVMAPLQLVEEDQRYLVSSPVMGAFGWVLDSHDQDADIL